MLYELLDTCFRRYDNFDGSVWVGAEMTVRPLEKLREHNKMKGRVEL
jgi:hypothetical protein